VLQGGKVFLGFLFFSTINTSARMREAVVVCAEVHKSYIRELLCKVGQFVLDVCSAL